MRSFFSIAVTGGVLLFTGLVARADSQRDNFGFQITNLVTDGNPGSLPAAVTDPNLVNPWGVAFNPNGAVLVADNGTGLATSYDGNGRIQPLVITIPPPSSDPTATAAPTGVVFNGDPNAFLLDGSNAAMFIFATEDGTIAAWNPNFNSTEAVLEVDTSNDPEPAVYKGLALASDGTSRFLYAADFHNAKVDVFDEAFHLVPPDGRFIDPNLPAGFAPFGIQNILGDVFVTYALQDAAKHDNVSGPHLGFVDVFTAKGKLVQRFASRGPLNAPWGVALAPVSFGDFGSTLLVGNFGDSVINAFDFRTGRFMGSIRTPTGADPQGLWGLAFGNGLDNQPTNTLFFAAGTNDENNGLYARIDVAPPQQQPCNGHRQ